MAQQKKSLTTIIVLTAIAIVITITTSGVLSAISSFQTVQTGGALTQLQTTINVGVYADSPCTQNATFVDWGTLSPGETTTKTVWIKNLGNSALTLSLTTNNWTPENAQTDIELSWNHQGIILQANEVLQAVLTLSISPTIDPSITSFNFNIQITGTT
ncbi:MAG: hypothetical protein GX638_11480 [Crenarchaeota archaeon]|nr:hypothetical protein [Thermoproteota archaeon]